MDHVILFLEIVMTAVNSLISPFTESSNPQFPLLPYTYYTPESQEQTESICWLSWSQYLSGLLNIYQRNEQLLDEFKKKIVGNAFKQIVILSLS